MFNSRIRRGGGESASLWWQSDDDIYRATGNVVIGTSSPEHPLHAMGDLFLGTDAKEIRLSTDGLFVDLESEGENVTCRSTGSATKRSSTPPAESWGSAIFYPW